MGSSLNVHVMMFNSVKLGSTPVKTKKLNLRINLQLRQNTRLHSSLTSFSSQVKPPQTFVSVSNAATSLNTHAHTLEILQNIFVFCFFPFC